MKRGARRHEGSGEGENRRGKGKGDEKKVEPCVVKKEK